VILQLNVKWAGNPNIILAARAFGLKATVQVRRCGNQLHLTMFLHVLRRLRSAAVVIWHEGGGLLPEVKLD
jgi:hypothetical protein